MYTIGYDIGSSSVKASLVETETGKVVGTVFHPKEEMKINAPHPDWAEQDPRMWWDNVKLCTQELLVKNGIAGTAVAAIGISYQMHGLVCVNAAQEVVRPAIIWCDSRAVPVGHRAFTALGAEYCLEHLLNSPGNFTASKLAWVKENEPSVYARIDKVMLPGDYIAMRLTGETVTTVSGLSEGVFWDFKENKIAENLLAYYGIEKEKLAAVVPTFGEQGRVRTSVAAELGLAAGTPVTYRAGDQPNNALSLNVFQPGEIASTAGTSGVVYGVNGVVNYDPLSRVNTFAHVNHSPQQIRLGVLLCINGTGCLNSWMRRMVAPQGMGYDAMNQLAAQAPVGSDGVTVLPFGNGAERMLGNKPSSCVVEGVNFNLHDRPHLIRAAQEGIVFSFKYGIDIMQEMGMEVKKIHAGMANMFLSPLFCTTLAGVTGAVIELYDTDGSVGAARGAGLGAGIYASEKEAFHALKRKQVIEPVATDSEQYQQAYAHWFSLLQRMQVGR